MNIWDDLIVDPETVYVQEESPEPAEPAEPTTPATNYDPEAVESAIAILSPDDPFSEPIDSPVTTPSTPASTEPSPTETV